MYRMLKSVKLKKDIVLALENVLKPEHSLEYVRDQGECPVLSERYLR